MVLFNTQFYVNADFDRHILLKFLKDWLISSKRYVFSDKEINSIKEDELNYDKVFEAYSEKNPEIHQELMLYDMKDACSIHLKVTEGSDIFTNTYVLRGSVMAISLSKYSKEATIQQSQTQVNIPKLMRQIFWEEYGGMDGDLPTDDKVICIRKSNIQTAADIITGNVKHINPVVYISTYQNGRYPLVADMLAQDLVGIAHVVIEGSPVVSKSICDILDDENKDRLPKDGQVCVFMPNGDRVAFNEDNYNSHVLSKTIKNSLYQAMAMKDVPQEFSFQYIKQGCILDKYKDNDELTELFDSVIADKDNEIAELEDKVKDLTSKIMNLQAKEKSMQKKYLITDDGSDTECVKLVAGEKELYPGEINDVILKLIASTVKSMSGDSTLESSRKYHVLSNLLALNTVTGQDILISKTLDSALKNGEISGETARQLSAYGFKIIPCKKHTKIQFGDDERYVAMLSNTVSDYRAGNNIASIYKNLLFGF